MHWRIKNFLDAALEILDLYRRYFIFLLYLTVSILLFQYNSNIETDFLRQRLFGVAAFVGRAIWETRKTSDPEDAIRRLKRQNIELTKRNLALEDAYLENVRLRQMLLFSQRFPLQSVASRIVAKAPDATFNAVVLDKGTRAGIAGYHAVMTDKGLVGKIVAAREQFSVCQLMLDQNFRVTAKIQRTRLNGIVQWEGRSNEVGFYGVLKNLDVRVGDVILTSEFSEFFPPNFMIGVVSRVNNEVSGIFKEITVQTAVDFTRLEEVFVVTDTSRTLSARGGFEDYFLNRLTP